MRPFQSTRVHAARTPCRGSRSAESLPEKLSGPALSCDACADVARARAARTCGGNGARTCTAKVARTRGGARARRGLTLVEVLISMFVLLIGLLGVAAMLPAGKFEIQQGTQIDNATTVGRAAFRNMKVRGFLDVASWANPNGSAVWQFDSALPPPQRRFRFYTLAPPSFSPAPSDNVAVAIDPLGLLAPFGSDPEKATFPFAAGVNAPAEPYLSRIIPTVRFVDGTVANPAALADLWFRNSDDLTFTANSRDSDQPNTQTILLEDSVLVGTVRAKVAEDVLPADVPIKRLSEGNYSWLATIVSDPAAPATQGKVTVSVAVYFKRDLTQPGKAERVATVQSIPGQGLGGGEFVINWPPVVPTPPLTPIEPIKPGQWVMLAGRISHPDPYDSTITIDSDYFRWYRVVAADTPQAPIQRVTLAGPDWNVLTPSNVRLWAFENIVAVYEKNMRLEMP